MITDFILPAIEKFDSENMWFQQQDCATCHTTRTNMALLQEILTISTDHEDHEI